MAAVYNVRRRTELGDAVTWPEQFARKCPDPPLVCYVQCAAPSCGAGLSYVDAKEPEFTPGGSELLVGKGWRVQDGRFVCPDHEGGRGWWGRARS